jgi:hypothetical protein
MAHFGPKNEELCPGSIATTYPASLAGKFLALQEDNELIGLIEKRELADS